MRRNSNDMQVNVAGIRRNIKNFAHNYSDAQKKVREATSNDPWGPSSTLMAVIADQTYNVVAFSEIMQMVWKRLNDHGKNWRHVYKALVLLEYMIKTGSEKVAQQCRENIFAIQTLKDFQYLEEGKDQGQNVREKAKQLVNLLKDDERLKNERARALKAKERFAQNSSGFGSDGGLDTPTSPKYPAFKGDWNSREEAADLPREIEIARPQTAGEEELQLQLALAMSREEAEQEEQKRKSDDVRLQLALSQSQNDFKKSHEKLHQSHMVDLLDVQLGDPEPVDPWGMPQPPRPQSLDLSLFGQWYTPMMQSSPWQASSLPSPPNNPLPSADPWLPPSHAAPKQDPWGVPVVAPSVSPVVMGGATASTNKHDPWSPTSPASSTDLDEFDVITNRNRATSPKTNGNLVSSDPFELNLLGDTLSDTSTNIATGATKKTPQSFLGENSALVNLDNLVTTNKQTNPSLTANPFSDTAAAPPRPVFNTAPPKPSINEMKQQTFAPFSSSTAGAFGGNPPAPVGFTPAPYGINSQFMPSQVGSVFSTNSNGNAFGGAPQAQDPWTPVPNAVSNGTNSAWIKSNEPANPFLS